MKCVGDTIAIRASVGISSALAKSRSIASRARSIRRLLSSVSARTPGVYVERNRTDRTVRLATVLNCSAPGGIRTPDQELRSYNSRNAVLTSSFSVIRESVAA